jgi:hypothetical protein
MARIRPVLKQFFMRQLNNGSFAAAGIATHGRRGGLAQAMESPLPPTTRRSNAGLKNMAAIGGFIPIQ